MVLLDRNTLACSMYALIFVLTIRAYFLPEVSVPKEAKVNGNLTGDIEIPKGCLIAAIMRDSEFEVPWGNTHTSWQPRSLHRSSLCLKKAFDLFILKK
jgi:hypothetical protein